MSDDGRWTGERDLANQSTSQYDQLIENLKYKTLEMVQFDVFGNSNNFFSIYQGSDQRETKVEKDNKENDRSPVTKADSFSTLVSLPPSKYGAIEIKDMALLPSTEQEFEAILNKLIKTWKENGVRSVQIFFQAPKCHLMNVASRHGFYFHHAHRASNYVMMSKWLDEASEDRLPAFANHLVGVGGIVLSADNEVLMVQERRADGRWKFPGGFVDNGETIRQGVEREVMEETGVPSKFKGVLAIREQMNYQYGAADLYVVCVLEPASSGSQGINI